MRAIDQIRYEPYDKSPVPVTLGVAVQGAVLALSNTVTLVTIFAVASDGSPTYLSWAVFASLLIGGLATAHQAIKFGRLGPGYIMLMGPGSPFLPVCVLAVAEGGLPVMSSLIVAASLVQFALAFWLAKLRRVITPVVSGVAFMIIAVAAMPIAVARLEDVAADSPSLAGPAVGAATLAAATILMLRGSGIWRLMAIPITIVRGLYRRRAPWRLRLPACSRRPLVRPPRVLRLARVRPRPRPGLPRPASRIPCRERCRWHQSRQRGRCNPAGIVSKTARHRLPQRPGNVERGRRGNTPVGHCGYAAHYHLPAFDDIPDTFHRCRLPARGLCRRGHADRAGPAPEDCRHPPHNPPTRHRLNPDDRHGDALRRGCPDRPAGRIQPAKGLYRRDIPVNRGSGYRRRNILADPLGPTWGVAFGNSVVVSILAAVLMSGITQLTGHRSRRLQTELDIASLPGIQDFLRTIGDRIGWSQASIQRMCYAGEETLASMLQLRDDYEGDKPPRLVIIARPASGMVEMEFFGGILRGEHRGPHLVHDRAGRGP